MPELPATILAERFRRVALLLCDVDGVLTDGTLWMGGGMEWKRFHIQDGLGLRVLQRQGVRVGWVSNRPSQATAQRAEDLKVDFLYQDNAGKVAAVESILAQAAVSWDQVCYIGDDVVDLAVMRRVGAPVAVANAIEEVRAQAMYVTQKPGGHGAVREVVELILKAQDRWSKIIQEFSA